MSIDYEQSLFFVGPPRQNARDTQMTSRKFQGIFEDFSRKITVFKDENLFNNSPYLTPFWTRQWQKLVMESFTILTSSAMVDNIL